MLSAVRAPEFPPWGFTESTNLLCPQQIQMDSDKHGSSSTVLSQSNSRGKLFIFHCCSVSSLVNNHLKKIAVQ